MKNAEYRTVNLTIETHQKLKLLSMLMEKPIVGCIEEMVDEEIDKHPAISSSLDKMISLESEIRRQKDIIALQLAKAGKAA